MSRALRAVFVCSVAAGFVVACGSEGSTFDVGEGKEDGGGAPPAIFSPTEPLPDGGELAIDPSCRRRTCAEQDIECGPAGDGCGGIIPDCGQCGAGLRCGGPGALSKCVSPLVGTGCEPTTCEALGVECGLAGDGCGGVLTCGSCGVGEQCGAVGMPSKCVPAVATLPDGGACVPKTCADYAAQNKDCGPQSNGCGGTIDCGTCTAPEFCGGGGPSKCGVAGGGDCTPKTCADFPGKCGPQSDGCGGTTVSCGPCTAPEICGGGGVPSVCGGGSAAGVDGGACVAKATCAPGECGKVADGCGGVFDCGTSGCPAGTLCGGGGVPNVCGAPACTPLTACPPQMNCGSIADGCGGVVECGDGNGCALPKLCGGGGVANVCGGGGIAGDGGAPCTPLTCAQTGKDCGPVADGCGGIVTCPMCASPKVCGGGGVPSMCGGENQCTKKTVADCGADSCGYMADGCGGLVDCGGCTGGGTCGVYTPNVCGDATGGPCTGFCLNQEKTCAAGQKTRITGKVYAPNGTLPLPDALVYVPNGAASSPWGVAAISSGVGGGSCEQCNQPASGSPLVTTKSAADGSFTLENVPAGVAFPLVIQLGKWRRMVTIPAVARCTAQALTSDQTRLPKRQNEGGQGIDNIPFVAISTGRVDGLECVFRKLGIEVDQFGDPPGTTGSGSLDRGRIRLYQDTDHGKNCANSKRSGACGGAVMSTQTPRTDAALTDSQAHLDQYDAVIFSCPGDAFNRPSQVLGRVRDYADKGGRVFATHFEYDYLHTNAPWNSTAAWNVKNNNPGNVTWTGRINTGSAKRLLFSQWLDAPGVKALTGASPPRVSIVEPRNDVDQPVSSGAEEWITHHDDSRTNRAVLHYTFNTPWSNPPENQCGRVLFSDFHVSIGNTRGKTFPSHCTGGLTDQEKILAFFLFDLTSCIQVPPPATCTKKTCADYPANTCGVQSDGCGGTTADCGECTGGKTCGGGGEPNKCGGATCTPRTCAQSNAECGVIPNGCGDTINCGECTGGKVCGGGGVPYQCAVSTCTPKTCQEQGIQCGRTGDGCGNVIDCDPCPAGTTCGGGGVPNQCGAPTCVPLTQCPPGKNCGDMPDGCGGSIHCGDCASDTTCGGGGAPNVCGAASCAPKSCAAQGAECGLVSDGCGSVLDCLGCPDGDYCNPQNLCVSPDCTPKTCGQLGVECGPTADTCGGLLACGDCPPGMGCGAGGVPGKCGKVPCTPRTCNDLGAVCGQVADGCGGLTPSCGDCQGALSCKNGACVNACKPRTCAEALANCGPISDGCGGLVDCGPCPPGDTCGFNGRPNICGSDGPK